MPDIRATIVRGTGQRIAKLRSILGYTRDIMAKKLDLQRASYYKNEVGLTVPSLETLFFLQRDYDISIDWLLFEKGPMYFSQRKAVPNKNVEEVKPPSAIESLVPDIKDLLESMEKDPLFRHEVMLNFYKYKKKVSHSGESVSEDVVDGISNLTDSNT